MAIAEAPWRADRGSPWHRTTEHFSFFLESTGGISNGYKEEVSLLGTDCLLYFNFAVYLPIRCKAQESPGLPCSLCHPRDKQVLSISSWELSG
jgi:hypothetical protein